MFENKDLFHGYAVMVIGTILTIILSLGLTSVLSADLREIITSLIAIGGLLISGFIGGLLAKKYYLKAVRNTALIEFCFIMVIGALFALVITIASSGILRGPLGGVLVLFLFFGASIIVTLITSVFFLISAYFGHKISLKKIDTI